ncbi:MAG: SDR family oxidoreductase [Spirochaetia bacterium]|nr:SDR family oxidoreductase [Spirochaetia bacterium]
MISFSKEQVFIVTGASSGIGKTVALLLNELGATVVAIARREDKLEIMKSESKYPGNINIEIKDLTENIETLPQYLKMLKDKYGKFAGMAYCAGVTQIKPIQSVEFTEIKKVFDINYFAPIFMVKGLVDRRCNIGKGTSIVAIASAGAIGCDPGMTCYSGSKGALISSLKSISREVARQGIRINTVSPTLINTDMAGEIERQYAEGKYPLGIGEPYDVANLIVYLLSDKAKWIASQNYIIDCGAL